MSLFDSKYECFHIYDSLYIMFGYVGDKNRILILTHRLRNILNAFIVNPHLIVISNFHQDHPPVLNQLDSSSNPSSTTSSTPSSPAPFQQSNPPSATPPPNPSPKGHRDSRFNFPGGGHDTLSCVHRTCAETCTFLQHFSETKAFSLD